MIEGVCRRCGCTDGVACQGGCAWVDEGRTLCNLCAFTDEIFAARPSLIVTAPLPHELEKFAADAGMEIMSAFPI